MTIKDISKIAVVGAGTMGQGIAQISAMAGYEVVLYDLNAEALEKASTIIDSNLSKGIARGKLTQADKEAALKRIAFSDDENMLVADVVIEAIVEKLEVKKYYSHV